MGTRVEPCFDAPVADGGYAWWYLDAVSDDARHGLTVIAFIGSVFSPYYARARRRAPGAAADAANHCALNVALYGQPGARWSMTERGRTHLQRAPDSLLIGPSALTWQGDTLCIEVDEIAAPWPARIRGVIKLHAPRRFHHPVALAAGGHVWHPIAPTARVEVTLTHPQWQWQGSAYLDANRGDTPLESAFERWDWSRAHLRDGRAVVLYDVQRRGAEPLSLGLEFGRSDGVRTLDPPPAARLPASGWRIARGTRSDSGVARVRRTLTDAPFYARSLVDTELLGEPVTAMHESLSLRRFDTAWVQAMLPFRMPRRTR
jgi:carotenoid 1,2-hydratase